MYPTGVHKYYDMYSFDGFLKYYTSLLWYEFCNVVGVMFLWGTPLDLILDWVNGLSFDRATEILVLELGEASRRDLGIDLMGCIIYVLLVERDV